MNIRIILLLFFISFMFDSCDKKVSPEIELEYDANVPNDGLKINIKDGLKEIKVEKTYLLTEGQYRGYNYAYPEIIKLNDTSLMMVAKSSVANIQDFANADLIKLLSFDKGKTWREGNYTSTPFPGAINSSMPSILRINENKLLLIYLVKYNDDRIDLKVEDSEDNGRTWSAPRTIFGENQGYQIINNSRAILAGKTIFLPVCIPDGGTIKSYLKGQTSLSIFYYYSEDFGKSWKKSKAIRSSQYDLLEPGLIFNGNKELLYNIRTDKGKVLFARSFDFGKNWRFEESNINSPSSPQTIKRIPGTDKLIMVWNDSQFNVSTHGGNRSPLSLASSSDGGRNWTKLLNLEPFNNYVKDYAYVAIEFDNEYAYFAYNERDNKTSSFAIKMSKIKLSSLK